MSSGNDEKYFQVKLEVLQDGVVLYRRESQIAVAETRLEGVQMLDTEVQGMWTDINRAANIAQTQLETQEEAQRSKEK